LLTRLLPTLGQQVGDGHQTRALDASPRLREGAPAPVPHQADPVHRWRTRHPEVLLVMIGSDSRAISSSASLGVLFPWNTSLTMALNRVRMSATSGKRPSSRPLSSVARAVVRLTSFG